MKHESYEALFSAGDQYIYVQYLYDDMEYDFDYTIFDRDFNDIDGGVIGESGTAIPFGGDWDLQRAAEEIAGYSAGVIRLDLDEFRDRFE